MGLVKHVLYLLVTCLCLSTINGQLSRLSLVFQHVKDPNARSLSEMWLDDVNINLIQNKICFGGSDATFVLRANPASGTMEVVAKSLALDVAEPDVKSCRPSFSPVVCDADMCQEDASCSVRALVRCELDNDVSDWETTQFIDFVLYQRSGHLAMLDCMEECTYADSDEIAATGEGHGLPTWALGLIIAGAVVLGALCVAAFVVWKIRSSAPTSKKFCGKLTCAK
uniref:Uncharacterized protein n=1 Tax=Biomphalaria glabrata TaxID=6526 RepID=A0A2C9KF55_BIOGL